MQYEDFKDGCQYLPFNRKEVFYTATVLPALLFHNGRHNFYRFLGDIDGFPPDIDELNTSDQFLFYTEYNLKQAASHTIVGPDIEAASNDTPDLLILILRPRKLLIGIEGKMFSMPSQPELDQQMRSQREVVLDPIADNLGLGQDSVFHVALLPRKLGLADRCDYRVMKWELFFNAAAFDVRDNYFLNPLRFALDNYEQLVSKRSARASTMEDEWKGQRVAAEARIDTCFWVGRQGGEAAIRDDINKGVWRTRKYPINSMKPAKGRAGQWIRGSRFLELLQQCDPHSSV